MTILVGGAMAACAVYDASLVANEGASVGAGGSSTGDSGAGGGGGTSGASAVGGAGRDGGGASNAAGGAGGSSGNSGGMPGSGATGGPSAGAGTGGAGGSSGAGSAGGSSGAGGVSGSGGAGGVSGRGGAGGVSGAGGAGGRGGAGGVSGSGGAGGVSGRGGAGGATGGSAGSVGGSGGSGAAGGQAGNGDAGTLPILDLIDDMEDGDKFIPNRNSRDGSWFAGGDGTVGSILQPANTGVFTMSAIVPPRGSSTTAAHLQGQGFKIWGAVIGVKPRGDATLADGGAAPIPYDASAYCGVHFFAMGSGAMQRMDIPDKFTNPSGGICNPNDTTGQTACFDHFGMAMTLTTAWTEYNVSFSSLRDRGTSAVSTTFHPEAIFQIEISSRDVSGAPFDIWIDDIAFIAKPASGTCP